MKLLALGCALFLGACANDCPDCGASSDPTLGFALLGAGLQMMAAPAAPAYVPAPMITTNCVRTPVGMNCSSY